MTKRKGPIQAAKDFVNQFHPNASACFLGGSVTIGKETKSSDLDIVIIYKELESAKRSSFLFEGWPVEAFIHDLETLNYFCQKVDYPNNYMALAKMIANGILISDSNEITETSIKLANDLLTLGPKEIDQGHDQRIRYYITDLLDDLRDFRNESELMFIGAKLLEVLSDYILISKGHWSGKGKWLGRELLDLDKEFAKELLLSFDKLFKDKNTDMVISLTEKIMNQKGGLLFEGYTLDAPKDWRLPLN